MIRNLLLGVTLSVVGSVALAGQHLVLSQKDTVSIRGPITSQSADQFRESISKIRGDDINVVIASPGGSIIAGAQIISAIRGEQSKGKTVNCLVEFGASMAFVITQSCTNRLVLESSILMQHQASAGVQQQPMANLNSFVRFLNQVVEAQETMQAKRIGLSTKAFTDLTHDDLWVYGSQNKQMNIADDVVTAECTRAMLDDTIDEDFQTFFGTIKVTWSACPLLSNPKSVAMKNSWTEPKGFEVLKNLFYTKEPIRDPSDLARLIP